MSIKGSSIGAGSISSEAAAGTIDAGATGDLKETGLTTDADFVVLVGISINR
jgi:hypothetical protein